MRAIAQAEACGSVWLTCYSLRLGIVLVFKPSVRYGLAIVNDNL
jgi:hypothetical protein